MAKDKDNIIGGFDVFKAAQRAAEESRGTTRRPKDLVKGGVDAGGQKSAARKIGSHIGSTVMPTKHHVMCYECTYEFNVSGKVKSTFCPKCRTNLTFEDLVVEDEYEGDLKTAGTITVMENGVVKDGELFANFVILHGAVQGGALHAYHELELGPNARVDWSRVETKNLKIGPNAEYTLANCSYHNVDVYGILHADVSATGTVTVRSSGCLEGTVQSVGLVVEEGGGLKAVLKVMQADGENTEATASATPIGTGAGGDKRP